ncbi:maleylpyruvate isomerase family mycothiol-dependent enzyme [Mycobacterium sp.]|uniref:maleylpyruvate isomerase family mycothiol-dependent enzyme n=1 Tax=Mycobacterium sp. TaxID=1785 RepID=UPI0025E8C37F|nr:maleylpyruvate isomerase family mycothiol-dependent enzyme [Mycobacterium sp.]
MDALEQWTQAQDRVIDLVADLDTAAANRAVPACPDWTVQQLLAHMIGLDADVLAGDEPDDHNSDWTQRQVRERTDRSLSELLDEWRSLRAPLVEWMQQNNTRPLGDIVIHEQDLRGALGRSGGQHTPAQAAIRDMFVQKFSDAVAQLEPIALVGDSWTWASRGGVDDAEVVVTATDFDLARSLVSRRSEKQLRDWTTRGDISPYLDSFQTLGPLPDDDLTETF